MGFSFWVFLVLLIQLEGGRILSSAVRYYTIIYNNDIPILFPEDTHNLLEFPLSKYTLWKLRTTPKCLSYCNSQELDDGSV